jgi:PKD repeat protein
MIERFLHSSFWRSLPLGQITSAATLLLGLTLIFLGGCSLFPNVPPSAQISADSTHGIAPLAIQFDGTPSEDTDGVVCSFAWAFGDGVTSEAMRPTHVFSQPGEYLVTLTVKDNDGASAATTLTIYVEKPNLAPTAAFSVDASTASVEVPIQFDAASSSDPDGWIADYGWDFGDGTTSEGRAVEHAYTQTGVYIVVLTVSDNDGATTTRQTQVHITDDDNAAPQPYVTLSTTSLEPGETVVCSAAGSLDPDGEIASFEWIFGDGSRAEGVTATHAYTATGTYRISLTVTDDQGMEKTVERTVNVGSPAVAPEPSVDSEQFSFSARWSYAGSVHSLSLEIPLSLYESYQGDSRGVWGSEGYSPFVLDTRDDALMIELRDALLVNNSYQSTIENALAFVQRAVDYQLDPAGTEYPRYPVETLVDGVGDCEDSAILYASIVRTFGYTAGVLLISVDTNGDQVADHAAVLVRVADCFITAHPDRSLWDISGRTYAFAETAVSGGYLALGVDPWGLETEDIQYIWDVANPSLQLSASRRQP